METMEKFIESSREVVAVFNDVDVDDTFVVWSCWIAGNKKALIGSHTGDKYVEATYIANLGKTVFDIYKKVDKIVMVDYDKVPVDFTTDPDEWECVFQKPCPWRDDKEAFDYCFKGYSKEDFERLEEEKDKLYIKYEE